MLISHRHRFIFIKTRKTAGTSLEIDLCRIMGPEDVVTPIVPAEAGHAPRNYRRWRTKFYHHMSASEVRKAVGPAVFDSYFKFCVEREPIDKCISQYSMKRNSKVHNRKTAAMAWEDYIEKGDFPVDGDKYTDRDGMLLVDRIVRYETLGEEMAEIARDLGFDFDLRARAKSGWRETVMVTEDHRNTIYDAFASTLRFTGYAPV